MLVGRLANMKPTQPTNAGLAHAAKVFAAMPFTGSDPEAIERALGLFLPFARALFLEVATIVFFGIGLGHKVEAKSASVPLELTRFRSFRNRSRRSGTMGKADAEQDLAIYMARYGNVPSQQFLKERWGVGSKATISRWLNDWEKQGQIGRFRDGKCKVTTAKLN